MDRKIRKKSLVSKSLMQFIGCTVVVLLLTTPLFYWLTKQFYAEDLMHVMEHIRLGIPAPTLDLEKDIMEGLMIQFILIFGVLSLSLLVTMRLMTKRMWKPFDDTLSKIEQFNLEHSEIPNFISTDISEFIRLNNATEKLMNRDKGSYKTQKEFTENASHELQTPIAIFQSKLDLLMQENLNEKQAEIVSELYAVSNRLSRLNKDLLLLAKIGNRQVGQFEEINIIRSIDRSIALFGDLYPSRAIAVSDLSSRPIRLLVNQMLFESLVNNLVVNAIRNSAPNSVIGIEVDDWSMTVSNKNDTGKLDEKHLFQRFHKIGDLKSGNGLGLAIVKAICDYHGWIIRYSFEKGMHRFQVIFSQ